MIKEQLQKAIELNSSIEKYEKILMALESKYANVIKAENWYGDRSEGQIIDLSNEPELEKMIKNYFLKKKETLEKAFAEL